VGFLSYVPGMIERLLGPRAEAAYTLLRVSSGLMFSFHGIQKIFGVLTDHAPAVGSQVWFGGIIEIGAGLAIAAGVCTAWAAFVASGEMAVAYVQFHWKLATGAQFLPTVNKGELALLYSLLFLFIAARGGGRWSLDHRRRTGRA
jgi:putative oxidoreductase